MQPNHDPERGDRTTFGPFELDAATGELWREGRPVPLQPQPAKVLALLVERAGELVTRSEIKARIWGLETFVDFDRGLNFAVAQVRQALSDSADVPRFIQTLPRQGYRFIAPVSRPLAPARTTVADSTSAVRAPATTDSPGVGSPPPQQTSASLPRAPAAIARLAAFVSALLVATIAAVWWTGQTIATTDPAIRVAIVRFDNDTKDIADEPLVQGLTDITVARLAELGRGLHVIGNADVLQAGRAFDRVQTIRAAIDPDYIVVGQFQRHDDRVRVVAHLLAASDLRHVWARPFETSAADRFGLQRELGEAIASAVWSRLRRADSRLRRFSSAAPLHDTATY